MYLWLAVEHYKMLSVDNFVYKNADFISGGLCILKISTVRNSKTNCCGEKIFDELPKVIIIKIVPHVLS